MAKKLIAIHSYNYRKVVLVEQNTLTLYIYLLRKNIKKGLIGENTKDINRCCICERITCIYVQRLRVELRILVR